MWAVPIDIWNSSASERMLRRRSVSTALSSKAMASVATICAWPGRARSADNARPHVAKIVQETLAKKNWEVLHHPAYSPDLSPCDFHLFGPLKKALKGQRFNSDADVKTAVTTWFSEQPRTFFSDGIRRLPKQWDACLNAYGDFFWWTQVHSYSQVVALFNSVETVNLRMILFK